MRIDFTVVERPENALDLSLWERDRRLEISPEDAALAGIDIAKLDRQYFLHQRDVQFVFSKQHLLLMRAEKVTADIRSDRSLRSVVVLSPSLDVPQIHSLALRLVKEWDLFAVNPEEEMADDIAPEDWKPTKLDATETLHRWQQSPPDTIPSNFAQSEPSPTQTIAFVRVVVIPMTDSPGLYRLSAHVSWFSPPT